MKENDKYKNKAGVTAKVESINGLMRLVIRDKNGRATQTIKPKDIDLNNFEKIE